MMKYPWEVRPEEEVTDMPTSNRAQRRARYRKEKAQHRRGQRGYIASQKQVEKDARGDYR